MSTIVDRFEKIKFKISSLNPNKAVNIIAVSKTFTFEHIKPLLDHGHFHFGENKVQEAIEKWTTIKEDQPQIQLHMIGKLQTNKVKYAVKLFDFIHSVDSEKLVKKISEEQSKVNRKIKIFIQVNIGNENQKSGINKDELNKLISYGKELNLDIVGLMCIPPVEIDPNNFFLEMNEINKSFNLPELSMGMSSDYTDAAKNNSTYLRIGSSIFGQRS